MRPDPLCLDVLSHNHALLSLHLTNIDLRVFTRATPPRDPHISWHWVPEFLCQVVSPRIQAVVSEITINDVDELEVLDWTHIARSLSRPQFSQLRYVFFMMSILEAEVERRIYEKLPECLERGIIQVCQLHQLSGMIGRDFHFLDSRTRTHSSLNPLDALGA